LAYDAIPTTISLAMNRHVDHPDRHVSPRLARTMRIAQELGAALAAVVAELRRLNRIGAGAGSRGERVRIVKQTLALRGKGLNRCC
jgi:hypothetical protein